MIFNFSICFFFLAFLTSETSQRITASSRTFEPLQKINITEHKLNITEVTRPQMELSQIYILAGGGLLIVFFLCAIVRELYTCKSKKSKNTREQIRAYDLSEDIVQERVELVSKEPSPKRNLTKSTECVEAQYSNIDNGIEIGHSKMSIERQRATLGILTGLFRCISKMRRTKTFVEV